MQSTTIFFQLKLSINFEIYSLKKETLELKD